MTNKWNLQKEFILASCSPQRLKLLFDAGFEPKECIAADIDESVLKGEKPAHYVKRVAAQKASFVALKHPNECIVAADTIIVVKGKIIRKAKDAAVARQNLDLISNSKHSVLTGYSVITPSGKQITGLVRTTVYIKKITENEKIALIQSGEWKNVAAYRIEGMLSTFVKKIKGSYPNIVGLPVYEIGDILKDVLR